MERVGLSQQRLADVATAACARGHGEDGAADVLDVLVEGVAGAEPALNRDELALRVTLEADEEEPRFELAEALVDAVGEGVAATQNPLAAVGRGRGEADVGVDGDRRFAAAFGIEVEWVGLLAAAEGGALVLVAADRRLLVFQRRAVPDLEQHADAAGDQIAAPAHPGGAFVADPDEALHRFGVLGADVRRAVLEAHQVARRVLAAAGARGAAEAELRPTHYDRAATDPRLVADRVEGDLGIVGAGLHADVAAAFPRVQLVGGQRWDLAQRGGAFAL